jgi:hypothetical protein
LEEADMSAAVQLEVKPAVDMSPHCSLPIPSHSNYKSQSDSQVEYSFGHSQVAVSDYLTRYNYSAGKATLELAELVEEAERTSGVVIAEWEKDTL